LEKAGAIVFGLCVESIFLVSLLLGLGGPRFQGPLDKLLDRPGGRNITTGVNVFLSALMCF
jgi:hypothetical protein